MNIRKRDWISYDNLTPSNKRFRSLNLTLMVLMATASISFLIYYLSTGDTNNRALSCVGVLLITLLPFAIEMILRIRLNNFLFFLYLLYFFFAGFLGCVLNFYNSTFLNLNNWYDVFIHLLAGYTFCFLGMFVLSKIEQYNKLSIWTIVVFAFVFSLACELVWELLERFVDLYLGQNAQGVKIEGTSSPLLSDTLADMFCNFIGGLLFGIHYILGKRSKYSLGIDFIENEIAYKGIVRPGKQGETFSLKTKEKYKVDILIAKEDYETNILEQKEQQNE